MLVAMMTEDIDYTDLEGKFKVPALNENYSNIIIIDHLPKVDEKKSEKLLAVLKKNIFVGNGNIVQDGIFMPMNSDGLTKGYLFVELETIDQAEAVLKVAHGYRLDKQHVLYAFRFTDFERLANLEEEFREPEVAPFKEHEYLHSWLLDPTAREQFVALHAGTTTISWVNRVGQPEQVESRQQWTEHFVQWSSKGSYLSTIHSQGVALWGGSSWKMIARFPHHGVRLIDFSPQESYLITWSPHDSRRAGEPNLLIWDIVAQRLAKGFIVEGSLSEGAWPLLRWSYNDGFVVKVQEDGLAVYESPSFGLLDKTIVPVQKARDLQWSPSNNLLCYWCPEGANVPARVAITEFPSKQVIRNKNLFNVNSCRPYWQDNGKYLAIVVNRHGKNKNVVFSNLELFRIQEKSIPVDVIEFETELAMFAWEPTGHRFAIVRNPDAIRSLFSIYTMTAVDNGLSTVKMIGSVHERKPLTKIAWSPRGDFLLLSILSGPAAGFELFHAGEASSFITRDHYMATECEWNQSGNYIATYITYSKHQMDNGFIIWDAKGDQVCKVPVQKFQSFNWRPRPPTLLDAAAIKEVKKNMKTFITKYEAEDAQQADQTSGEEAALRSRLLKEWSQWRSSIKSTIQDKIVGEDTVDNVTEVEEWVEEIVEEIEQAPTPEELEDLQD